MVRYTPHDGSMPSDSDLARLWDDVTISRILKAKIKVGDRVINAPMQEEPKNGSLYWYVDESPSVDNYVWRNDNVDIKMFAARNCWHTEEDAQAYVDATLVLRSTIVKE